MNNYCRNCGNKLDKDAKFCSKCSAEVFDDRIDVEKKKKELEVYRKKENIFIIVVICLYVLPYFLHYLHFISDAVVSFIGPLSYLCATVILIYARIMMHDSIKIKVLFYIIISLVIIYILFMILLFVTCLGFAELIDKGCN